MKTRSRRRKMLVGGIQRRFVAFQVACFLVFAAVFVTATFGPLVIDLLARETPPDERTAAAAQLLALQEHVWPALVVVLLLFGFHALMVSHRFAGPLVRFRRTFELVAGGDLTQRVLLRRHDYLKPEARALDQMVNALRDRVHALAGEADALGREIERLERQPDVARVADLAPLRAAHAALAARLADFRTGETGSFQPGPGSGQGQAAGSELERDTPVLSAP
jgi:methyl-accepting chemotaxis protein